MEILFPSHPVPFPPNEKKKKKNRSTRDLLVGPIFMSAPTHRGSDQEADMQESVLDFHIPFSIIQDQQLIEQTPLTANKHP